MRPDSFLMKLRCLRICIARRRNLEFIPLEISVVHLKGFIESDVALQKLERLRAIISGAYEIQQLVTLCCYLEKEAETVRNAEQKLSQVLIFIMTYAAITSVHKFRNFKDVSQIYISVACCRI